MLETAQLQTIPETVTQADWQRGLWLNNGEAAAFAGRHKSRINNMKDELPCVFGGSSRLYHASTLAQLWPNGPGAKAYLKGETAYAAWVKANLERPASDT